MTYSDIVCGVFLRRLNRFVAEVDIGGELVRVHVRNTGRCTSVLVPGREVSLQKSADPGRTTQYTLIAVNTPGYGWVNLDSLAPNKLAGEWLRSRGFTQIKPEYGFGSSRVDFYAERNGERWLIEVKGCTLAKNGVAFFPDAPTKRGTKHLRELSGAVPQGHRSMILFVIMLRGVTSVEPNSGVDPEFAAEYARAAAAGVLTGTVTCGCTEDSVSIVRSSAPL